MGENNGPQGKTSSARKNPWPTRQNVVLQGKMMVHEVELLPCKGRKSRLQSNKPARENNSPEGVLLAQEVTISPGGKISQQKCHPPPPLKVRCS
mmetsp:Transcript_28733/g.65702  ORF Transcript_28733/g.65702 Transcript_28733/m.65702 type:complete len:94 (-) Transcript_28733:222-503(-)